MTIGFPQLSPSTRVLSVLILLIAIALTPNGQWVTWLFYGGGLLGMVGMSGISVRQLIQRLTVEMLFVGVAALGMLFREGGQIVWQWGWLKVTTVGLVMLSSVSCKLLLSLLLLNLLTLTTPIPDLLQALHQLKVPPLLVAILNAMYRYLEVLMDEVQVMRSAAISRNLFARKQWQRLVVGNLIGALFIRTYDRGDRIHQAMVARGYRGDWSGLRSRNSTAQINGYWITLVIIWATLGQCIPYLN